MSKPIVPAVIAIVIAGVLTLWAADRKKGSPADGSAPAACEGCNLSEKGEACCATEKKAPSACCDTKAASHGGDASPGHADPGMKTQDTKADVPADHAAPVEKFEDAGVQPAGRGQGRGGQVGRGGRGPGGPPAEMREAMAVFHSLLSDHEKIRRTVEQTPDGVVTVTTSDDPQVAQKLKTHVKQMKARVGAGLPIRMWDPLFSELVRQYARMEMQIEELPNGVKVRHSSANAQVVKLIRLHAEGVSRFVAHGWDKAHDATELPADYQAPR